MLAVDDGIQPLGEQLVPCDPSRLVKRHGMTEAYIDDTIDQIADQCGSGALAQFESGCGNALMVTTDQSRHGSHTQ